MRPDFAFYFACLLALGVCQNQGGGAGDGLGARSSTTTPITSSSSDVYDDVVAATSASSAFSITVAPALSTAYTAGEAVTISWTSVYQYTFDAVILKYTYSSSLASTTIFSVTDCVLSSGLCVQSATSEVTAVSSTAILPRARAEDNYSNGGVYTYTVTGIAVPTAIGSFEVLQVGSPGIISSTGSQFTYVSASSAATSSLTSYSSATATTITTPASTSTSGLSTGAKVGIAVGCLAFAMLILISALILLCRCRKRNATSGHLHHTPYLNKSGPIPSSTTIQAEKANHQISIQPTSSSYELMHTSPHPQHEVFSDIPPVPHASNWGTRDTETQRRSFSRMVGVNTSLSGGPGRMDQDERSNVSNSPPSHSPVESSPIGEASPIRSLPITPTRPGGENKAMALLMGGGQGGAGREAMSSEERQRWDEEEAQIDAAIEEADRRRDSVRLS